MSDRILGNVRLADRAGRADVTIEDGRIAALGPAGQGGAAREDCDGLLLLPGIVDLHGDGFERQIEPRPGVAFPLDVALVETDRQLLANGITTAFHGVSVSWEPGLRSLGTASALVEAIAGMRDRLGCDTRLHIRWETFALDALGTVLDWLEAAPRSVVAFNDHTTGTIEKAPIARKLAQWAERAGLSPEDYRARLDAAWARRAEVPAAIERLAAAARGAGAVLLAHDERTREERERYRAIGAAASEFPMTRETAAAAREAGEHVILGAPNVLRGGSHNAMMSAGEAVADGLCTVLASDYYYPAPMLAAFRLAAEGVLDLAAAWALVSAHPAEVAGLSDRGRIAPGLRADLLLVDDRLAERPRVAASFVAGHRVYAAG